MQGGQGHCVDLLKFIHTHTDGQTDTHKQKHALLQDHNLVMVVLLLYNCRLNTTVIRQYYNFWIPPYNLQYEYTNATAMQLSYEYYNTSTKLQILYKWWVGW